MTGDDWLQLAVSVPEPGIRLVHAAGELDILNAPELGDFLADQLADPPTHLIVDLTAVQFLSSSGMSVLVRARSTADGVGTKLYLAGTATRAVHTPLIATGLLPLFDSYPTVGEALADIQTGYGAG